MLNSYGFLSSFAIRNKLLYNLNGEREMVGVRHMRLKLYFARFLRFFRNVLSRSAEDNIKGLGAQMSYYFILSFFPFLMFIIAILSYTTITGEEFISGLSAYLPPDIYQIVANSIRITVESRSAILLSFGALTTLWIASNAIRVLMRGINMAYDFEETRPYWKVKLLAVLFSLILAGVYIFSLVLIVFGALIARQLAALFQISDYFVYMWNFFRYITPIATIFIAFIIIYNYMPCKKIGIRKTIPGALFSTFSWMIISQIFSIYVNNFGATAEAYGSLGGIIILLVWIYWCAVAIMFGAEINSTLYYFRKKKGIV